MTRGTGHCTFRSRRSRITGGQEEPRIQEVILEVTPLNDGKSSCDRPVGGVIGQPRNLKETNLGPVGDCECHRTIRKIGLQVGKPQTQIIAFRIRIAE